MAVSGGRRVRARSGAALWLLCSQFFVAEQVARFHVQGPYSMAQNVISDLGAVHSFGVKASATTSFSTLHSLMNASFVLQGLLIFFGAILLRRFFPPVALAGAATLFFALSAIGVFVVGLAPEDTAGLLHVVAAIMHFLCGGLAMLLVGLALQRKQGAGLAGLLSLAASAVALTATLLLGLRSTALWQSLGWEIGAVERVAAYPLPLWLSVTGLLFLVRSGRPNPINSQ